MEESLKENKRICLCGCGQEVVSRCNRNWEKNRIRFCIGHRPKRLRPRKEEPPRPCACGCGGQVTNKRNRFMYQHGSRGKKPWNFRGYGEAAGYEWVYLPSHHFATKNRHTVLKHRLIWEEYHKAVLLPWAIVHHKNDITTDNRIENLDAMIRYKHNFIHKPRKNMSDRVCIICHSNTTPTYKHKNGFRYSSWYRAENGWFCRSCYRNLRR